MTSSATIVKNSQTQFAQYRYYQKSLLCVKAQRTDSICLECSVLQDREQVLVASGGQRLLDSCALLVPTWHLHASQRHLDDPLQQLVGLLLLLKSGILDDTLGGGIAYIHLIRQVFIRHHKVSDHVDDNASVLVILVHSDVLFYASISSGIIRCDLHNFGK